MYAIVSSLDKHHHQKVVNIWKDLKENFGICPNFTEPLPHFSYNVAKDYKIEKVQSILSSLAGKTAKLPIKTTNALGVFLAPKKVIYIPIIRSLELSLFQKKLWRQIEEYSIDLSGYYSPDSWLPHISLASDGLTDENMPQILNYLSQNNYQWDFSIGNISIICEECPVDVEGNNFHLGSCLKTIAKIPI